MTSHVTQKIAILVTRDVVTGSRVNPPPNMGTVFSERFLVKKIYSVPDFGLPKITGAAKPRAAEIGLGGANCPLLFSKIADGFTCAFGSVK